jgi:hypothetical protein
MFGTSFFYGHTINLIQLRYTGWSPDFSAELQLFPARGAGFPKGCCLKEALVKKWFVLAVVLMMVAGVQAKEKGKGKKDIAGASSITKSAFIETQKKKAEAAGIAFDQAKAETAFATQDKDNDGTLTPDEMTPAGKKSKGKKK